MRCCRPVSCRVLRHRRLIDNPLDILLLLVYGAMKSKVADFAREGDVFKKSIVILPLLFYINVGHTEWI